MLEKRSINYKGLLLGILLNALVITVFILLYHAYVVTPQIEGGGGILCPESDEGMELPEE